ncbi:hypothetical protein GQ43DRAFT_469139 [Delitschia confertaspora ATCC 74209]|uniref:BZIP domain-containing protein n=1 Tax=Delitschia confertaspora ATCC 74209 TaxID=1513339 RepID=A0A9P4JTY8_9PLEO|nr:hypothetical protein GQ43DRAFT_469139 [Delitschia confertaspora ATCC 74209]
MPTARHSVCMTLGVMVFELVALSWAANDSFSSRNINPTGYPDDGSQNPTPNGYMGPWVSVQQRGNQWAPVQQNITPQAPVQQRGNPGTGIAGHPWNQAPQRGNSWPLVQQNGSVGNRGQQIVHIRDLPDILPELSSNPWGLVGTAPEQNQYGNLGTHRRRAILNDDAVRARYLEKNRLAASRCRTKQKQKIEELVQTSKQHERRNLCLKAEEEGLRGERSFLLELAQQHVDCGCDRIHNYMQRIADDLGNQGSSGARENPPGQSENPSGDGENPSSKEKENSPSGDSDPPSATVTSSWSSFSASPSSNSQSTQGPTATTLPMNDAEPATYPDIMEKLIEEVEQLIYDQESEYGRLEVSMKALMADEVSLMEILYDDDEWVRYRVFDLFSRQYV